MKKMKLKETDRLQSFFLQALAIFCLSFALFFLVYYVFLYFYDDYGKIHSNQHHVDNREPHKVLKVAMDCHAIFFHISIFFYNESCNSPTTCFREDNLKPNT